MRYPTGFSTEVVQKQDCINQQPDNERHERDKPDFEHLIHIEEKTSHKQISALRIGSWNVRGLASKRNYKLKNQTFVDYLQEYDIIISTETWTNTKCDLSLPDYNYFLIHRPRPTRAKRDSEGIVVYYKNIFSNLLSLHKQSDDNVLWLKLSKDFLNIDNYLYICACYVTPSQSSRVELSDVFNKLLNDLAEIETKCGKDHYTLIAGDFNARTGERADFIDFDNDIDTDVPETHVLCKPRCSKDKKKKPNAQGISLLDLCKASSMSLINGRFGKDAGIGEYTCITNNGCSVVDYISCSSHCVDLLTGFCVCDPTVYSDHSLLNIEFKASEQVNESVNIPTKCEKKIKFDRDKKDVYVEQLLKDSTMERMVNICSGKCDTEDGVNDMFYKFTQVLTDIAKLLFGKSYNVARSTTSSLS